MNRRLEASVLPTLRRAYLSLLLTLAACSTPDLAAVNLAGDASPDVSVDASSESAPPDATGGTTITDAGTADVHDADAGRREAGARDGGPTCGYSCKDTYCRNIDPNIGDSCDQCLSDKASICVAEAREDCSFDADCTALLTCVETIAKCNDRDAAAPPADAGGDEACGLRPKTSGPNDCLNCCVGNHRAGAQAYDKAERTCYCR